MTPRSVLAAALLCATIPATAPAAWLHYRGPGFAGTTTEKIPAGVKEPKQLWKTNVGIGTAAITVDGGHAFTAGNADKKTDSIVCLDLATGKPVWTHTYPQPLDPNLFEGGPRATPTIDGDFVYTVSQEGDLFCLAKATGKVKWKKNLVSDFGGKKPGWGYAGSPTIEGNLLYVEPGGRGSSTVALNKTTGEPVWKSGDDEAGYASPVVAELAKKPTLVLFKAKALVGLEPKTGRELWRTEWKTDYDINAATPLVFGNNIVVTSGYGTGIGLFEVTPTGIVEKWRNRSLRAHINTPVVRKNAIFGIDGNTGGGNLVCLDLATGTKKWEEKSLKGGSLILADDKLVVLSEKGELVIADATPAGFKPVLRSQVLDKRCWVQPTLTDGKLLAKNNVGDVACFEVN